MDGQVFVTSSGDNLIRIWDFSKTSDENPDDQSDECTSCNIRYSLEPIFWRKESAFSDTREHGFISQQTFLGLSRV